MRTVIGMKTVGVALLLGTGLMACLVYLWGAASYLWIN